MFQWPGLRAWSMFVQKIVLPFFVCVFHLRPLGSLQSVRSYWIIHYSNHLKRKVQIISIQFGFGCFSYELSMSNQPFVQTTHTVRALSSCLSLCLPHFTMFSFDGFVVNYAILERSLLNGQIHRFFQLKIPFLLLHSDWSCSCHCRSYSSVVSLTLGCCADGEISSCRKSNWIHFIWCLFTTIIFVSSVQWVHIFYFFGRLFHSLHSMHITMGAVESDREKSNWATNERERRERRETRQWKHQETTRHTTFSSAMVVWHLYAMLTIASMCVNIHMKRGAHTHSLTVRSIVLWWHCWQTSVHWINTFPDKQKDKHISEFFVCFFFFFFFYLFSCVA